MSSCIITIKLYVLVQLEREYMTFFLKSNLGPFSDRVSLRLQKNLYLKKNGRTVQKL